MIHAFAIEPQLVATWGRRDEFRFIYDKFGLGTPRVLLELPAFNKWRGKVLRAATDLALSEMEMKRIEALLKVFEEHKHRRSDSVFEGVLSWLENAEREYARRPFAGILATQNPRNMAAVLVSEQLDASTSWVCALGASPSRTPEELALVLSPMLTNCRELHLVDPHFGPENARHRKVLEALMTVLGSNGVRPERIRMHCSAKATLGFFEQEAAKMSARLPSGLSIEFVRWQQKAEGERLHNRYVLTDVGGVSLGVGLDAGDPNETDDILLLPHAQFTKRWGQYVLENGAFDCVDRPATITGTGRVAPTGRGV